MDLTVFNKFMYDTFTEVLDQQVNLFNQATRGAILLDTVRDNVGDYSDRVFWKKVTGGLTRRRDAYGTGSVTPKTLSDETQTKVKVAAGTPPINFTPSDFTWIKKSPDEAGAVIGRQLAVDTMKDMLNVSIASLVGAIGNVGVTLTKDVTGATDDEFTYANMNLAAALLGDRSQDIVCWICHSTLYHDLIGSNIANSADLFNFETLRVTTDHMGRPIIITDESALIDTSTNPDVYYALGLQRGAAEIEQNGDFNQEMTTVTGGENITKQYQAEWTYNLGLKGFSWDKTNGGASPDNAALATGSNWGKVATSIKDCAGVLLKCNNTANTNN